MLVFRQFPDAESARDFRRITGAGGWIFVAVKSGEAWLFPPHMTATEIFEHSLTHGKSGHLIA